MQSWIEKRFRLRENNTNIRTEMLAGITTFITMVYVLGTIPNMLASAGLDKGVMLAAIDRRAHV